MTITDASKSYDVVIIGAGPVGTGLAVDLGQRGWRVCVVEKYPEPQRIPKGQNLTQRTGEHLMRWGVSRGIRDATLIPPEYGNQGITAYGSWLSGLHYDWFKRASVSEYYFADNERLPQYETERVLRERAAELDGVDIVTGRTYASHVDTADGVRIEIAETDAQEVSETLEAKWLIGCDGARSAVRDATGIEQSVDSRDRRMALVTFRSSSLSKLLAERFPGRTIFNAIHPDLAGYWQFLGRTDPVDSFFFHAPVPDDAAVDTFDFAQLLRRAAGVEVDANLEYAGFWDLRFTQARNYRKGRVFVAGDAAHSHPPYGGYGVNVGFEDARNLAWKLDAVLTGWGTDALLDTYSTERHPVFASTRDDFIARMIADDAAFTAHFDPNTDEKAFEAAWRERATGGQAEVQLYVPNYAGSPIVVGDKGASSGAVGEHTHEARAGFHLSPQSPGTKRALFDAVGKGFSLIVVGQSVGAVDDFKNGGIALGMPLSVVQLELNADTQKWGSTMILIRPDEHIVWAGDSCEDVESLLRQAIAA